MSKLGGYGRVDGLAAGLAAGSTLDYGYGGSSTPILILATATPIIIPTATLTATPATTGCVCRN
jgi:hypothetical protein